MASLRSSVTVAVTVLMVLTTSQSKAQPPEEVSWVDLMRNLERLGKVTIEADQAMPVVSVSAAQDSTATRGLLRLRWQERRVASVELLRIGDEFIVADTDWTVSSKAPLGRWHEVPPADVDRPDGLPDVGTVISGVPNGR